MDNTGSDFEKVKYFNDWLCDNNTYNETTLVTKMRYIITGAMIYGDTDEKKSISLSKLRFCVEISL